MPRRELLTPTERVQLFAFPSDEGELIRLATLARGDLTYIRQHRGDHNRLGLAIQMVYSLIQVGCSRPAKHHTRRCSASWLRN